MLSAIEPPSSWSRALRASLIVLFASLGLFECRPRVEPEPPPTHQRRPNRTVALRGPSLAYVRVEPALPVDGELNWALVARVAFDERHLATIGPPVQGRVASVNVVTGDHVERGQVLLTIHAPEIAAAEASVVEARNARMLAESAAARARRLYDEQAGSQAEMQQSAAALAQAVAEERRSTAAVAALGGAHGSSDYQLHSPIAGTVVERHVTVGSEVHADQDASLLTIADLTTVWIQADVYEQDMLLVRRGEPATVRLHAFPGRTWPGTIAYVSDVVDPQTRSARARIELSNPDLALRPGMFAHVEVRGTAQGAADVPNSAVLARRDQFFVFVRNPDGTFSQREVRLGEQHGANVTISQGLTAGEPVVTEGAILLDAEANEAL